MLCKIATRNDEKVVIFFHKKLVGIGSNREGRQQSIFQVCCCMCVRFKYCAVFEFPRLRLVWRRTGRCHKSCAYTNIVNSIRYCSIPHRRLIYFSSVLLQNGLFGFSQLWLVPWETCRRLKRCVITNIKISLDTPLFWIFPVVAGATGKCYEWCVHININWCIYNMLEIFYRLGMSTAMVLTRSSYLTGSVRDEPVWPRSEPIISGKTKNTTDGWRGELLFTKV